MPVGVQSHSIPYRSIVSRIPAKFSAAYRSIVRISSGKRSTPLRSPCVSEPSRKPPLRPLAPKPTVSCSSSTTSRVGSSSFAWIAAHRPVKPPPTIARSVSVSPASASAGSGASGASSQNGTVAASDQLRARDSVTRP